VARTCGGDVRRHIHAIFDAGTVAGMTDGELLRRFATGGREAAEVAFAAIVERHGPMVLRVCRIIVGDEHEARDAFQATFLVLVSRPGSVRRGDSLASWLHGVARRVSCCARSATARRRAHEGRAADLAPGHAAGVPDGDDALPVIHEEIERLPERYRRPIILCDLEGLTHEEAARHLGWPVGTVKSRQARGRERLRGRLVRRGLAPAAGMIGGLLGIEPAQAALPAMMAESTARAALGFATVGAGARGGASAAAVALSEEVLMAMLLNKLTWWSGVVVALGLLMAGALATAAREVRDGPPPAAGAPAPLPDRASVRDALRAWWAGIETLEFREVESAVGDDGRPVQSGRHPIVEVALGRGDRRAVMHGSLGPDGRARVAEEKRDDGRTQFYLLSNAEAPDKITDATVKDQTNTRDSYHDEMSTVLWLLTPWTIKRFDARPLYLHLDAGAKLEIGRGPDGKPSVVMTLEYGSQRYELDPDHDYLPKRVTGSLYDVSVTSFAKDNGRWFPAEGLVTEKTQPAPKGTRRTFAVAGLRINRPIPDSRFERPPDLEAVRVLDLTRGGRASRPVGR
jgi:RNA polymerase sigma factor (sigma-70 family)